MLDFLVSCCLVLMSLVTLQLLNIALEKQAIGRVHRLGQTRPVRVTKLVLKNSLETRILDVQEKQHTQEGGSSSSTGRSVGWVQ